MIIDARARFNARRRPAQTVENEWARLGREREALRETFKNATHWRAPELGRMPFDQFCEMQR